jgi:hypothetical protein
VERQQEQQKAAKGGGTAIHEGISIFGVQKRASRIIDRVLRQTGRDRILVNLQSGVRKGLIQKP